MENRNKTRVAGSLSIAASIITLIIYGLAFLAVAGYIVVVVALIGGLASSTGSSSDVAGASALLVLTLFAIFVPLIVMGILGCVFGTKMQKMALINDGRFYRSKKKLVTYDVFIYIFALISLALGIITMISGILPSQDEQGIVYVIAKIPFSLISGILYLLSGILLSVDISKNKEKFKLAKEGKLDVSQNVFPQAAQTISAPQPQIITLKEGEEIPEHLKGRIVPVEKDKEK